MGGTRELSETVLCFFKKKLPPKQEYRFYTFGNYCLIVIRCRKSYSVRKIILKILFIQIFISIFTLKLKK